MKKINHGLTFSAWAGLVLGLQAGPVAAQAECASDADCELGFSCEVVGGTGGCAVMPCSDGQECLVTDCPPPQDIYGCVPARDCQSDADCAEGFVCETRSYEMCAGSDMPDCSSEEDCRAPLPAECERVEESACVPRWQAECTVDADCGAGFTCVEQQACWCNAGGAEADPAPEMDPAGLLPPAEDGGMSDPVEPDCGCEPTGKYSCELVETVCESDADCGPGLGCQADPNGVVCSGGGAAPTPADDGMGTPPPADEGVDFAPPIDEPMCSVPRMLCLPPNYDGGYGYPVYVGEDGGTTGGQNSGSGDPQPATPPTTEVDDRGEAPAGGFADLDGSGKPSNSKGGLACSVGQSGGGLSQLGVIGLALLGLRRRRRG